jgi:MFS family permease
MSVSASAPAAVLLGRGARRRVLAAAFLAWMFAGLEISLFVLIHRPMMLSLLGERVEEQVVTRWFAWYQAAFMFGAAAGGWLFGWLGDRVGRTRALAASVLSYSLPTLACYAADTPELLLALRALAGLGVGGTWPNAVALVSEAWPAASRPLLSGLLGAAANVGFVLLGAIGYFVAITPDAWRWVLLVGASPCALGALVLVAVPESARWLAARKAPRAAADQSPLREVLRRPLLYRTLLGVALGAIPVVGTSANGNWLVPWSDHVAQQDGTEKKVADPRSKAVTQMTRSLGAVVGSLMGGAVASLVGRRLSYFLISLGAFATSSYVFTQLDPRHPQFHLFVFLLGLVGVTYFGWLPLFLPELFPTRVRSTGAGISFNSGRVVAAAVVLSTGLVIDRLHGDYALVGFWSGTIYALGMVIIWIAPRQDTGRLED